MKAKQIGPCRYYDLTADGKIVASRSACRTLATALNDERHLAR